jgi:hypothetical protein
VQSGQGYLVGGGRTWIRALRWVIVAGSVAIAVVLIARRDYVLGFLIGALALARVVFLIATSGRRPPVRWWNGAGSGRPGMVASTPGGGGPVRRVLRELARPEFAVAGREMGLDASQMRRAFDEGRSVAELATGVGVPLRRIVDAIVADATSTIDRRVAEGRISQQLASQVKARIPMWAARLVNFHKGDLRGPRSGLTT